ncbi:MAG: hypothetical protein DRQ60_05870 [Gammaproteobacteria bacterium]|nr:MAG: hypothetical protein DRQ54_05225 [Gammaproteobacteria bacterium]RLA15353.1 MAG: hypothetical protein DRQ60_05870 [Gammaproteobacteria bacterium]
MTNQPTSVDLATETNQPFTDAEKRLDNLVDISTLHHLAGAKITFSFSQGDESVSDLGGAITACSSTIRTLEQKSKECTDLDELKALVQQHCNTMNQHAHQAVTALQFYDLLSQQMEKVRGVVKELGELLTTPSEHLSKQQWIQQLATITLKLTGETGGETVCSKNDEDYELFAQTAAGGRSNAESDCEFF